MDINNDDISVTLRKKRERKRSRRRMHDARGSEVMLECITGVDRLLKKAGPTTEFSIYTSSEVFFPFSRLSLRDLPMSFLLGEKSDLVESQYKDIFFSSFER